MGVSEQRIVRLEKKIKELESNYGAADKLLALRQELEQNTDMYEWAAKERGTPIGKSQLDDLQRIREEIAALEREEALS